eukprot:1193479-Prorocentrum_minimum.AAC.2
MARALHGILSLKPQPVKLKRVGGLILQTGGVVLTGGVRKGLEQDPGTGMFNGGDGADTPPDLWTTSGGRFALVNR